MNTEQELGDQADTERKHSLLAVENLSCERSEITLFSNLSFALAKGESMRIEGPNGSGKTTLLRTVAGIHKPVAGHVRWNLSEPTVNQSADKPKIAYIGHASGLRGELTAIENLQFYARINRISSGLSPMECLESLGVAHCSALPCMRLSAGQKQRVALARLRLNQYDLWLLDEPATSLDDQGIELLQKFASNHAESGGTTVYCSHQSLDFGLGNNAEIDLRDFQDEFVQC